MIANLANKRFLMIQKDFVRFSIRYFQTQSDLPKMGRFRSKFSKLKTIQTIVSKLVSRTPELEW